MNTKDMKKKIVVDTSILVSWIAPVEDGLIGQAQNLWNDLTSGKKKFITSEIVFYELANVLFWKKGIKGKEFGEAMQLLREIPIEVIELSPEIIKVASAIMEIRGISFESAVFPAIAQVKSCQLISADKEHHSGLANVTMLSNLS